MPEQRVLIVDDEPDIRELLEITLSRMGLDTVSAANLESAYAELENSPFDLCLTDMHLPDGNGMQLVKHIQNALPDLPVAMITAFGSVETAIEALKVGAFDFVSKPIDLERLRNLVATALKIAAKHDVIGAGNEVQLLGETAAAKQLRDQIIKLARSQAPVYVSGESGAGKELVARLIHSNGPRASGPFVPVNCGAIPAELMESEFFGHKKGSFTGAVEDKLGLFRAAEGGTLFLDEVADLPLAMQVKLLRAIQEKAVRAVGENAEHPIDVRILSATHKNLSNEVANERFRNDLFYRINVIELKVPSLRERKADIPLLANFILDKLADENAQHKMQLADDALRALQDYAFPGNVRELENILERASTLCEGQRITARDLQLAPAVARNNLQTEKSAESTASTGALYPDVNVEQPVHSLEEFLENIEKDVIQRALEACRWNKTAAAERLGISFRALRYRLKKLDLN